MKLKRREFLQDISVASLIIATGSHAWGAKSSTTPLSRRRFCFTSQGKAAMMHADGSGLHYLTFAVPNQATWQPTAFFTDGRVLMLSMEPRRDGPGKPFSEYYHKTPTHIWIHDLDTGSLIEIATKERLAPFCTPQLLLNDGRMLIQVIRDKVPLTFSIHLETTLVPIIPAGFHNVTYHSMLLCSASSLSTVGSQRFLSWDSAALGRVP